MTNSKLIPKEVALDTENDIYLAYFDYYTGRKYIKTNNLKLTTSYKDIFDNKPVYIVQCEM